MLADIYHPTQEQRARFFELAVALEAVPARGEEHWMETARGKAQFNMWQMHLETDCGAICCALGLGALIHAPTKRITDHLEFGDLCYGISPASEANDIWAWCFGGHWAGGNDGRETGKAAAHRIYHLLQYNPKSTWAEQPWTHFIDDHPFDVVKAAAKAVCFPQGVSP